MGRSVNRTKKTAQSAAKPAAKSASAPTAPSKRAASPRSDRIVLSGGAREARRQRAHALADKWKRPLLAVDVSRIVSKSIGETEKNLAKLLASAAAANAILLFDEADALFGKRTEVKDSHDRYANIEVSYLLQRIERHAGVVILATNLRKNLDEAFVRRLRPAFVAVRAR